MVHNFQTVEDIAARLHSANREEFAALEHSLRADSRLGVQKALKAAKKRLCAEEAEEKRVDALYLFDREVSPGVVLGMDEVGRGSVAGPLAVGGVVLDCSKHILGLNDSKKLSAARREHVAHEIKQNASAWVVHYIGAEEIDTFGMAASLKMAFHAVITKVEEAGVIPDAILLDGVPLHLDPREHSMVKGDAKSASIAAASIVAKVARDKLMCDYAKQFPEYGFDSNKGYASAEHIAAIQKYGLSPLHRASFCTAFMQASLF